MAGERAKQNPAGSHEHVDLFFGIKPLTAMKRTVPPIFCKEGSIAGGVSDQENCRRGTLVQVFGPKNGFAFALHDTDLKQYIFATRAARSAREHSVAMRYGCVSFWISSHATAIENGSPETSTRRQIEELRCRRNAGAAMRLRSFSISRR
ncbi:hypothetical conserved protein [Rhizobium etli CFN 42]|uniref:Uncharacterized protein n=2 Tax=Rhizobium etli TaxID=29449 RepID=A0AAN1BI60_RHIET|nr:hypothetical protein [Rhizobium etli]ABC92092.1 hypothetical conserved protein [Rhizobium etli CFN 42]AGS23135.1 hypothetical protein REMIM1_CH03389 [Rhizobium etli bv. mimosae str. Mim1]ARQ11436.1 hypothetical protein NXC12_CH03454 [Rhizobium etli]